MNVRHRKPTPVFLVACLFIVLIGMTSVIWLAHHVIAIEMLAGGQTMFYTADGQPWFPLNAHRRDVPLERISPHLQQAVVAIEDHRFFRHAGIDAIAIGRAAVRNIGAGRVVQGGSTLTQQLARTLFLPKSRTYSRKVKEMALAVIIEWRLSKPRILELYLNHIYLGGSVRGVEAMSHNVFGKSAADLTLAESAFLAGLIRAPSDLSPWSHLDRARQRGRLVLARMRAERLITAEAERIAAAAQVRILTEAGLTEGASGYAADFLRDRFRRELGPDDPPGWKVQTSFVPAIQVAAERAVVSRLERLRMPGLQAALVALDPHTGDVLAMVGGRDYRRSPFNRAISARRQPGSAFKPLIYAAALDGGESPVSVLSGLTTPRVSGQDEWVVRNATAELRDSMTLREALVESSNRAAVRLQNHVGSKPVLLLAEAVGLKGMPDVPSLALGTGEVTPLALTAAYATFANGGYAVSPRALLRVVDRDGAVVFDQPIISTRVLSEGAAFQIVTMLEDVIDRGTGSAARALGVRFPAAGETGTTDDFKDAWFVGFSSSIVAGVWVGFDRPTAIASDGFGSRYALPIWAEFMSRTAHLRPPERFRLPSSVREVTLCRETYLLPGGNCPVYSEYFKPGDRVPQDECQLHRDDPWRRAGSAVGGVFSEIGRRLRRIFGR